MTDLFLSALKLLVAGLLGGIIGWERERHDRPAGLRTHILVCMGSALFTLVSDAYGVRVQSDPSRISAQVVSGIGFLGAGTILREGQVIRGLTTAASLWIVAAIGMAVGYSGPRQQELLALALLATLMVYLVLTVVGQLAEVWVARRAQHTLTIEMVEGTNSTDQVLELLANQGLIVRNAERSKVTETGDTLLTLTVQLPVGLKTLEVDRWLLRLPSIRRIVWD